MKRPNSRPSNSSAATRRKPPQTRKQSRCVFVDEGDSQRLPGVVADVPDVFAPPAVLGGQDAGDRLPPRRPLRTCLGMTRLPAASSTTSRLSLAEHFLSRTAWAVKRMTPAPGGMVTARWIIAGPLGPAVGAAHGAFEGRAVASRGGDDGADPPSHPASVPVWKSRFSAAGVSAGRLAARQRARARCMCLFRYGRGERGIRGASASNGHGGRGVQRAIPAARAGKHATPPPNWAKGSRITVSSPRRRSVIEQERRAVDECPGHVLAPSRCLSAGLPNSLTACVSRSHSASCPRWKGASSAFCSGVRFAASTARMRASASGGPPRLLPGLAAVATDSRNLPMLWSLPGNRWSSVIVSTAPPGSPTASSFPRRRRAACRTAVPPPSRSPGCCRCAGHRPTLLREVGHRPLEDDRLGRLRVVLRGPDAQRPGRGRASAPPGGPRVPRRSRSPTARSGRTTRSGPSASRGGRSSWPGCRRQRASACQAETRW